MGPHFLLERAMQRHHQNAEMEQRGREMEPESAMTAERKPSEIANALITLLGRLDGIDSGSPVTVARTNLANYVADNRDAILAALRSAAPPRGEPVAWMYQKRGFVARTFSDYRWSDWAQRGYDETPLYAAPSAGRDKETPNG